MWVVVRVFQRAGQQAVEEGVEGLGLGEQGFLAAAVIDEGVMQFDQHVVVVADIVERQVTQAQRAHGLGGGEVGDAGKGR